MLMMRLVRWWMAASHPGWQKRSVFVTWSGAEIWPHVLPWLIWMRVPWRVTNGLVGVKICGACCNIKG